MLNIVVAIVAICVFGPFTWLLILASIEWVISRIWDKSVAAHVTDWLMFAPIWVPLLTVGVWVISAIPALFAYILIGLFILCNFARQIAH